MVLYSTVAHYVHILHSFFNHYIQSLGNVGYFGLMFIMAIEGTCLPFFIPMELVVAPMGYLAALGQKNMFLLILSSTSGTILGCVFNYYFSMLLGRPFIYKYGKFFMLSRKKLDKIEKLFLKNSKLIMFLGRCTPIPGVKHIVTIPAGISKMNMFDFLLYNTLGALFYMTLILYIGYFTGGSKSIIQNIQPFAIAIFVVSVAFYAAFYFFTKKNK
jgi:membrane protein DedA with SNARE-associated domain